jgi:hypothetical protein
MFSPAKGAQLMTDWDDHCFEVIRKAREEEERRERLRIESEIKSLDSERSTMEDLMLQAQAQTVDLVRAWQKGDVNQRHELANAFFLKVSRSAINGSSLNRVIPLLLRCLGGFWKTSVTLASPTGFEPVLPP